VVDERGRTAAEQHVCQRTDHGKANVTFSDECSVHELAPVRSVRDDPALLEPSQNGCDGRLGQRPLGEKGCLSDCYRALSTLPKDADNGELEVGKMNIDKSSSASGAGKVGNRYLQMRHHNDIDRCCVSNSSKKVV
jgi:hypothetical protein